MGGHPSRRLAGGGRVSVHLVPAVEPWDVEENDLDARGELAVEHRHLAVPHGERSQTPRDEQPLSLEASVARQRDRDAVAELPQGFGETRDRVGGPAGPRVGAELGGDHQDFHGRAPILPRRSETKAARGRA